MQSLNFVSNFVKFLCESFFGCHKTKSKIAKFRRFFWPFFEVVFGSFSRVFGGFFEVSQNFGVSKFSVFAIFSSSISCNSRQ